METQLQVQTVYGVTRQATVSFPRCSPSCQNNGTCWWSKDAGALECVCSNYLYYGAQCQNSAQNPLPFVFVSSSTHRPNVLCVDGRVPGRRARPAGRVAYWR
jgi:hypothetical protein